MDFGRSMQLDVLIYSEPHFRRDSASLLENFIYETSIYQIYKHTSKQSGQ